MGREYELKYAATPAVLAALAAKFGPGREIRMETTYFDTPARTLSTRKMTLRLRRENGVSICTLKTPLPDGSRGEWECESADIHSGIAALLAGVVLAYRGKPLIVVSLACSAAVLVTEGLLKLL